MSVELRENVFDVIIYGCEANVELVGYFSCVVTLCQTS